MKEVEILEIRNFHINAITHRCWAFLWLFLLLSILPFQVSFHFLGFFFFPPFIHLLKKYLLRIYYISDTALDAKDHQRTKQIKTPTLVGFAFHWRETDNKQHSDCYIFHSIFECDKFWGVKESRIEKGELQALLEGYNFIQGKVKPHWEYDTDVKMGRGWVIWLRKSILDRWNSKLTVSKVRVSLECLKKSKKFSVLWLLQIE